MPLSKCVWKTCATAIHLPPSACVVLWLNTRASVFMLEESLGSGEQVLSVVSVSTQDMTEMKKREAFTCHDLKGVTLLNSNTKVTKILQIFSRQKLVLTFLDMCIIIYTFRGLTKQ